MPLHFLKTILCFLFLAHPASAMFEDIESELALEFHKDIQRINATLVKSKLQMTAMIEDIELMSAEMRSSIEKYGGSQIFVYIKSITRQNYLGVYAMEETDETVKMHRTNNRSLRSQLFHDITQFRGSIKLLTLKKDGIPVYPDGTPRKNIIDPKSNGIRSIKKDLKGLESMILSFQRIHARQNKIRTAAELPEQYLEFMENYSAKIQLMLEELNGGNR